MTETPRPTKRIIRSPWERPREDFTKAMRERQAEAGNTKEGQRINGLAGLREKP